MCLDPGLATPATTLSQLSRAGAVTLFLDDSGSDTGASSAPSKGIIAGQSFVSGLPRFLGNLMRVDWDFDAN